MRRSLIDIEDARRSRDAGRSSGSRDDWETPDDFFQALHEEFGFTIDACANQHNHKLERYCSPASSAFGNDFRGETVWCNPPYGKVAKRFARMAYEGAAAGDETWVLLVPPRTDAAWWHEYMMRATELRFVRGRIAFLEDGVPKDDNRHPSVLAVFVAGRVDRALGPRVRAYIQPKDRVADQARGKLL